MDDHLKGQLAGACKNRLPRHSGALADSFFFDNIATGIFDSARDS